MKRSVHFWVFIVCLLVLSACNGTTSPQDQAAQVAQAFLDVLSDWDEAGLQSIAVDELIISAKEYGFDDISDAPVAEPWSLDDVLALMHTLSLGDDPENDHLLVDFVRPLTWIDGPAITLFSDGRAAQAVGRVRVTHEYVVDVAPDGDDIDWYAEYHFAGLVNLILVDEEWKVSAFQLRPIASDELRPPVLKGHSRVFAPSGSYTMQDETVFCWGWTNEGGTGWMGYDARIFHEATGTIIWQDTNDFWISADEYMNWWGCVNSLDLPERLMEPGTYHIVAELFGGPDAESLTINDRIFLEFEHTAPSTSQGISQETDTSSIDVFDPDGALAAATRFLNALADYDADRFMASSTPDFTFEFLMYQDYDEAYYADGRFFDALHMWDRDTVLYELLESEYFFGLFHPFSWIADSIEVGVDPNTSTGWVLGAIELDHVYAPREFGVLNPIEQHWLHRYDILVELDYDQGRWLVTDYIVFAVERDPSHPPMVKLITSLMTSTGGSRLQPTDEALFCWGWENHGGTGSLGYEMTIYKDDEIWGEAADQFWVSAFERFMWWDCVPFPPRAEGDDLIEPGTYVVEVLVLEGLDDFDLKPAEASMRLFHVVND